MRTWTDAELRCAIESSNSLSEAITKLKLRTAGGNFTSISKHVKRLCLSVDHFVKFVPPTRSLSYEEVFMEGSLVRGSRLRKMTLKHEITPYLCKECGNTGQHSGKPLTLQLDHVNGVNNDNRPENLRFLCPNCHTQTPTYARRDFSRDKVRSQNATTTVTLICFGCQSIFEKAANKHRHRSARGQKEFYCSQSCGSRTRVDRNVVRTTHAELGSYLAVAKKLGVSDVTIRKIITGES